MSQLFSSNDPWENGWNEDDKYETNFGGVISDIDYPASYSQIAKNIGNISIEDLLSRVDISPYQKQNLLLTFFNQSLSLQKDTYKILGLIALELDTPGLGDIVTFNYRQGTLPKFDDDTIQGILHKKQRKLSEDFRDPLGVVTKPDVTSPVKELQSTWEARPPVIEDSQEQDLTPPAVLAGETSSILAENIAEINKYMNSVRDQFNPIIGSENIIKIKEVPEKEGLLFKHVNYLITNENNRGKKVIRRYSDFVWLLEFLLKKYPFRVIPGLPPKKFSGASPDSQFLQRRRRGLYRFLNQLIKHPILKVEPVVITFLNLPSDITTWKKQAKIDTSIEFKGEKIDTHFINSIWPTIGKEMTKNWSNCESSIINLIEIWTRIVILVERHERRQQQQGLDNTRFIDMVTKYKNLNFNLYPQDDLIMGENNKPDINSINDSLGSIANFYTKASQTIIDENYVINNEILEKFKNYLDYLYSLKDLFERTKVLSKNNIDELEKQTKEKEIKYNKLNQEDVDASGKNLAILRQSIINDKQEIFQQLNRDWLIKKCCLEELLMIQETQYLISEVWIDWNKNRFRSQEKLLNLQDDLNKEIVNDMPFNR